ncbi:hypothetical protein BJX68DRAFT_126915 [Aspergillus pseudodeflectus]|uniref:Mpv17/PMP22 family protein n=1 Tax=Aspergillus pseudodeflectus TaxID=176178 RepID=A0ABR4K1W2_9EURO
MPPSALTTTLIQSTFLNALSNILAQLIDQYKKDKPLIALNIPYLLQFITYGILIVPINVAWQRWLEVTYPGFLFSSSPTSTAATASASSTLPLSIPAANGAPSEGSRAARPRAGTVTDSKGGTMELVEVKEKLVPAASAAAPSTGRWSWRPRGLNSGSGKRQRIFNFAMKFLLDQTAGGVLNIILFVVLINVLKGASLERAWELVLEDFIPIMLARLKFRPIVSTLLYTVVPLERRVVFGSACGVIWGVYLSLYAAV